MDIYIDHFLLYSESPKYIYEKFRNNLNLLEVVPLSNFGFFTSGMLWMKNCNLEILNYPKNIPAPNSNQLKNRFVGIAFTTNLSPEKTFEILKKNKINSSDILNEDVLDKNGIKVTIAKVILLNDYFQDFRLFFIFYTNDFISKKEKELSSQECSRFINCKISVNSLGKIIDLFNTLGLNLIDKDYFLTIKDQKIQVIKSEDLSTEIISLEIINNDNKIDIITELKNLN